MDFFTKAGNYLYISSFKTLNFYTTTIIFQYLLLVLRSLSTIAGKVV